MFRLIKLLMMTAIGYVIYQLWQGMREVERQGGGRQRGDLGRALDEDTGRMMNMTGAGRGTTVTSGEDSSGMSVPHLVGRGVVQ